MKKFLLSVLFLLTFASCALSSIKNSPAGFRDVKWGDNLTVLGNNAIKTYSNSSMEVYIRPEDKLSLGDTPLTSIQYLFSYGELMAVAIEANTGEATNILSIFTQRYGTPIQPNRFLEKYEWSDSKIKIVYEKNIIKNIVNVTTMSTEQLKRTSIIQKNNANNAGADF